MWKTLPTILILLFAGQALAAEMYRCERADGTVTYTDDPSKAPPDCTPQPVQDVPEINIVPARSAPSPTQSAQRAPKKPTRESRSAAAFTQEAEALFTQLETTRTELHRAILAKDKQKARRELTAIRAEKNLLLEDLDRSTLTSTDKSRIREILSTIN